MAKDLKKIKTNKIMISLHLKCKIIAFLKLTTRKLELQRKIHQEILPDTELEASSTITTGKTKTKTIPKTSTQLSEQLKKQNTTDHPSSGSINDQKILCVNLEEKLTNVVKSTKKTGPALDCKKSSCLATLSHGRVNYEIINKSNLQTEIFQTKITTHVQQEINSENIEMFSKECKAGGQLCYKQNSKANDSLYNRVSSSSSQSLDASSVDEADELNRLNKGTSMDGFDVIVGDLDAKEVASEGEVNTRLFESGDNRVIYWYTDVPWKLYLKKEVFSPREKINEVLVVDLLFRQVMGDYNMPGTGSIRITEKDKIQLTNLLEINGFIGIISEPELDRFDETLKRKIIELAREWPFYFSRLFPVAVSIKN